MTPAIRTPEGVFYRSGTAPPAVVRRKLKSDLWSALVEAQSEIARCQQARDLAAEMVTEHKRLLKTALLRRYRHATPRNRQAILAWEGRAFEAQYRQRAAVQHLREVTRQIIAKYREARP